MPIDDDVDRLRRGWDEEDEASTRRVDYVDLGAPMLVAKTATKVTYPTSAARFYWCIPQSVFGDETEGGAGTLATDGGGFYALNIGSAIPPSGTAVVVWSLGSRWVFDYA